jgi:Ca2+/Na+ antiporter
MQTEPPKENLPQFKARVKQVESRRYMSGSLLKYVWPSLGLTFLFLILNLFKQLNCWWTLVGAFFIAVAIISVYLWFQFKKAEEFEERLRAERIRDMNGSLKCIYLEGKVPDGSGKIGKCVLYGFTLDAHPYCIYCYEHRAKLKG